MERASEAKTSNEEIFEAAGCGGCVVEYSMSDRELAGVHEMSTNSCCRWCESTDLSTPATS